VTANLVKDNRHVTLTAVLLAKLVVHSVVEHGLELLLSLVGGSVESLETLDIADPLFNRAVTSLSLVALGVRNTISTDIDEHLLARWGRVDQTANRCLGDRAWADPKRVQSPVLVKNVDALAKLGDRNQHVLVDVVILEVLENALNGEKLEEGDLGRDEPAESVSEQRVVSEPQNVGHLPENALGVAMVVVGGGDVLVTRAGLEEAANVLIEPGLVVAGDAVNLVRLGVVCHVAGHNNGSLLGVYQSLDKVNLLFASVLGNQIAVLLLGVARLVLKVNILTGRDNLDLSGNQETEGTVRPRDGIEKLRVLSGAALNEVSIGENDLVCDANVLEQAILVGRSLDTEAGNETTDSQIIKFGDDSGSPAKRTESGGKLAAANKRLNTDNTALLINLEDIDEVAQVSTEVGLLVRRVEDVGCLPVGTTYDT
jgi:hypothetical protein